MIINFKIYESNEPDLRGMSQHVKCIRTYKEYFLEGQVYKVICMRGDPQGAIKKYGINDYMPLECISAVLIENIEFELSLWFNIGNYKYLGMPNVTNKFFEYFELMEEADEAEKYNM